MTITALLLLLAAFSAAAQEPLPPAEPAPPAPEYVFAFAAPNTPEEAEAAVAEFAASDAIIMVAAPAAGVELAAPETKSLLVLGRDTLLHRQGDDAFYLFNPSVTGSTEGAAQEARRASRGARWSIGFMRAYEPLQHPRLDMVLFRDDPIDVLVTGTSSILDEMGVAKSAFSECLVYGPDAQRASPLLLFEVYTSGIKQRPLSADAP